MIINRLTILYVLDLIQFDLVFMIVTRNFLSFISLYLFLQLDLFSLVEGKLGKIDASLTLDSRYDSRVFGISSKSFNSAKTSASSIISQDELKSEDDFIISFTPSVHFTKKVKWFSFTGTAGVQLTQYVKNDDKSYTQPITTFSIDFDETLSKQKRVSNNAKIRFDATFDLGQSVGASVLDQDLTSFSYFTAGANIRYNHSPKFGIGGGTSYTLNWYQSGATQNRPYSDLSTLPLSAQAFYIYSEKLDFYTDYTFSQSKDNLSGSTTLSDSQSHSISFGAQGTYSSKLSGNTNIGYTVVNFDNVLAGSQDNLTTSVSLAWKLNKKSSLNFVIDRSFSPSAQGFSTFSTMSRVSGNHRFKEDLSAALYLSAGNVDYTYPTTMTKTSRDSNSLNQYGIGFSLVKQFSERITATSGYDYSLIDQTTENYGRHVIFANLIGRF